ncbi:GNAT family N-acetyltransferase [Photobacterium sp. WH77]|uniref:Acyl-homoserine-lactone synthase n=1 Tax=Photobacterium arenosum TaxID=2774143 RepID=A0ABR9BKW9_9GAMM|nr:MULTISPECIES: acyl-homoserine-lactone synthase [Photobacterium]MBD8512839.1 GNAT family N-acetyltransferase [Photobacterium arenosum]MBV7261073.1 GNAT family N-acetyltransferase [Photobacterium sp. WH24]MCG2835493.1 GNAT family N-acetyltransferase [Photobacterium sp. WH77]MCG2843106.1 GNAT family N-acetyltransferase [Photobacterium sp. WH80]MDO6580433.1 acyl-homoserine-lactone synthase [Photobacterium sp. 2_MG-2023]
MYRLVCTQFLNFDKNELDDLGRFRHDVFIKQLKWDLNITSLEEGIENDEFDTESALYVIAYNENDKIVGCARLIPSYSPYLLSDVFPYLCDSELPRDIATWEISRFAAYGHELESLPFDILKFSLQLAGMHGVKQLVAVTTVAIERYFLRRGVTLNRMGKVTKKGRDKLIALSFPVEQFDDNKLLNVIETEGSLLFYRSLPESEALLLS